MLLEVKVPEMGESITEATVADWRFKVGDHVENEDILVELETDKVSLEIPTPSAGILKEINAQAGANVALGDILALVAASDSSSSEAPKTQSQEKKEQANSSPKEETRNKEMPPSVARIAQEKKIDVSQVSGTGKRGQVTKSDMISYLDTKKAYSTAKPSNEKQEKRVPLSRLRARIAERLLEAQKTSAILTTFNEIDMQNAIFLRKKYKEKFQESYGVSLGFMSIFVKATIHALQQVPVVNAEMGENEIIYKNYYDISVAVGGPKGLVVPVIRNANSLSFAEIEMEISYLAGKVKEGTIELKDLEGGTFTISNGGIYGSLLSTPILNRPQSGILGIHSIQKRPVVVNDEICIRPMMYVALSYDHRLVDGKEAVTFLVKLKEAVENPERILLGI